MPVPQPKKLLWDRHLACPSYFCKKSIILDAATEGFSYAYIEQAAIRTCLDPTTDDNLIIAAIHNRVGGSGPFGCF